MVLVVLLVVSIITYTISIRVDPELRGGGYCGGGHGGGRGLEDLRRGDKHLGRYVYMYIQFGANTGSNYVRQYSNNKYQQQTTYIQIQDTLETKSAE